MKCYKKLMATSFVNIDRDISRLLPPDLRDWVPADHLAHFIIAAVEALDLRQVKVNTRGTGDAQYNFKRLHYLRTVLKKPESTHGRGGAAQNQRSIHKNERLDRLQTENPENASIG